ncbi:hypothetical protein QJQ45_016300 [Haematococcus lacustris]|nr:hypothetical protein QJQ45_016300 [Haematococcus lacustris]
MSQYGDHWKTLGLARDAGPDEIKAAFRKLALKLHPDRHASSAQHERTEAANRFKLITEAYEVLSNDKLRAAYKARHGGSSSSYTSSRSRGPGTAYPPGSGYPGSSSSSAWSSGSAGGAEAGYGYAYGQGSASYQSAYSSGYGYGASSSSSSRRSPWARGRYSCWSSFTRGVSSRKVEVAAGLGFSFFALLTYANVEAMWERRNAQCRSHLQRLSQAERTWECAPGEAAAVSPPAKAVVMVVAAVGLEFRVAMTLRLDLARVSLLWLAQGRWWVQVQQPLPAAMAAALVTAPPLHSSSSRGGKGWAWGWGSRAAAPPAAAPHGAGLTLPPGAPFLSSAMATGLAMIPNTPATAASLPAAQTPGATTAASRPYTPAYDPAPGPSSPGLMVVSAAERQQHLALMSLSELVALEEEAEAGPAPPAGSGAGGQAAGAASQFEAATTGQGSAAEGQAAGAGGQGPGAAWRPGPGAGGQEVARVALQSGALGEEQGEGAAPLKSCPTDPGYRAASLEGNTGPVLEVAPSRDSLGAGQVGKAGGEGGVKPWQAAYVDKAVIIPGPSPPGQMAGACSRQPLPSRG